MRLVEHNDGTHQSNWLQSGSISRNCQAHLWWLEEGRFDEAPRSHHLPQEACRWQEGHQALAGTRLHRQKRHVQADA